MRKRWVYVIVVVLVVGGVLVGVLGSREREPEYGGKKLSEWVITYETNYVHHPNVHSEEADEAPKAIRHIGTNALPFLLKWMAYETPRWQRTLFPALSKARMFRDLILAPYYEREDRADGAARAFEQLGPSAAASIPALARLMSNSTVRISAFRAVSALGFIGPDALPLLIPTLTNQDRAFRYAGVQSIGFMGTNALPAVPALVTLLNDPDGTVRCATANALRQIDPRALERATR